MKIKDYYNADCAKLLSQKIKIIFPEFKEKFFTDYIDKNVSDKEFSERMDVFADGFVQYLPNTYEQNIEIFGQIL